MKVRQVALLSTLIIDIAKDWQGYKITNLGAPTGAAEALRYGDEGLIDHDSLLNYVASKHLTLPAAIAAVLTDHTKAVHDALAINADQVDGEHAAAIVTDARVKAHFPDTLAAIISDHNLAAHPLAIVPTMDDAHVPDLNTLSGFPATDPVAGTGGLRTLGTGAQQAAAGNHTHTLTAEAQSVNKSAVATGNNQAEGYRLYPALGDSEELDPFITKTDTFSALSRAVAAAGFIGKETVADNLKMRLYMGGVQVAETGYLGTSLGLKSVMGDRALSGSQTVKATIKNYSATTRYFWMYSYNTGTTLQHPLLIVGSVAV